MEKAIDKIYNKINDERTARYGLNKGMKIVNGLTQFDKDWMGKRIRINGEEIAIYDIEAEQLNILLKLKRELKLK